MTPGLPPERLLGAPPTPTDLASLRDVVAEQRGLVTRRQCLAAGLSRKTLEVRLRREQWRAVHRGLYQTEPGRDDWLTAAYAAQLACGPTSAWSHRTAAFVHGIVREPPPLFELQVPHDYRTAAPSGVWLRRSRDLDVRVDPLVWPWRTTVEDTVLDVCYSASADEVAAILGRAFQRGLTCESAMSRRLALRSRYPARPLLSAMLCDVGSGAESTMEVRYLRDVESAHGLPRGSRQHPTTGYGTRRHDVGYPDFGVLVELDGSLGHADREDRQRDGRRDRAAAALGWLTVRAFWPDVTAGACTLAWQVAQVLVSRGWGGEPRRCRRFSCAEDRLTLRGGFDPSSGPNPPRTGSRGRSHGST